MDAGRIGECGEDEYAVGVVVDGEVDSQEDQGEKVI